ncbi:putative ribonuclease H-like domain-containing protein [Tanacetum coccineum]
MSSQNPSQTYPMPSPSVSTFTFPSTTEPVFSASTSEPVFESPNHTQSSQTTHDHTTWGILSKLKHSKEKDRRDPKGNIMILPPVSVEEQIAVQRETKVRTILLQSLPKDHMADFHHLNDARDIWLAVKARFRGNDESKKIGESTKAQSFPEFRVTITLKTKGGLDYLSFDDLYNKLRTLEIDAKGGSSYDSRGTSAPTHSAFIVNAPVGLTDLKREAREKMKSLITEDAARIDKKKIMMVEMWKVCSAQVYGMILELGGCCWFVKAVGMHVVPPPITRTFIPPSNNPDLDDTYVKSSSSKTNEPLDFTPSSVDFKTVSETADQQSNSTNDDSSFSFKENVKPPRNLCNKSGINSRSLCKRKSFSSKTWFHGYETNIPVPAGSQEIRPTLDPLVENHFLLLENNDARPITRSPTSLITTLFVELDNYNQLNMDEEMGTAVTLSDVNLGGNGDFWSGDGKITGKGTIRTSKLNFENVYYVEELQNFNLFSVSQICDTKNKVLFTNKECLVLSKEFQLPEISQVVLRIPRRHNLYCFSLSDIQPERDVTCLLAKASLEESTKWHKRMAHVNFKNITAKLSMGIVKCKPSKLFTNEHNYIACNKGKQHKASYKAITAVSTISAPLQLLHMDLLGPTSIRSIDHKYYSLVVTDDTLKRTPQQNGVAERKNRTLIEAARTMLADSKLPTMFWTKAVSTAGLGHEWYFDLDYLTDSLGYTLFKANQPAGSQDTNIHASIPADSDSECDEQVIVVPSFPSNSFSSAKQAYEGNATTEKHLSQPDLTTSRNRVPAGRVDSAAGVTNGPNDPSTPVFQPVHTAASSLPPGHSLGSSEHSSRYPSPSDLANSMSSFSEMEDIHHQSDTSIFSSSSYDDDFGGTVTNLAPSVIVDSVSTKRRGDHYTSSTQILWDLTHTFFNKEVQLKSLIAKQDVDATFVNQEDVWHLGPSTRLVAQGQSQEEGNDYDESAFLYGEIEEEVYVTQPKGFEDPHFPKHVYRVVKALYGLHQAPHLQGPDIQFAVSACSRYQVTPLTSNFNAVKKIFKYLKGQPKLGLMVPKRFSLVLEAYSDSDYAGSHGDRKSTTGGCNSWSDKWFMNVDLREASGIILMIKYSYWYGNMWLILLKATDLSYEQVLTSMEMFANMRLNFQGDHMPLLATMLLPAQPAIAGESSGEAEPSNPQCVPKQ